MQKPRAGEEVISEKGIRRINNFFEPQIIQSAPRTQKIIFPFVFLGTFPTQQPINKETDQLNSYAVGSTIAASLLSV